MVKKIRLLKMSDIEGYRRFTRKDSRVRGPYRKSTLVRYMTFSDLFKMK